MLKLNPRLASYFERDLIIKDLSDLEIEQKIKAYLHEMILDEKHRDQNQQHQLEHIQEEAESDTHPSDR